MPEDVRIVNLNLQNIVYLVSTIIFDMKKFQIFNCIKIDIPTTYFRFIYILDIQINFLKIGELFDEGKNLIVGNFDMAEKFEFFDVLPTLKK